MGFEQNGSGDNFSRPILIIRKFNNHKKSRKILCIVFL